MEKEKKANHFIKHPTYPGGDKAMTAFIYQNLKYPKAAFEVGLEGMVVIRYGIDRDGAVCEAKVIQTVGLGCDEEAVRVVKMLRFDVPTNRGMRVIFHKNARIQFKISKKQAVELPQNSPHPTQNMAINYVVTQSLKSENAESEVPKNAGGYSYTISFGK